MKRTSGLSVSPDGLDVVAHAGSVGLRLLVERIGLTRELAGAMARRSFVPVHDCGQVLSDVAVIRPSEREGTPSRRRGGDRRQRRAAPLRLRVRPVVSPLTVWRALDEVTPTRARKIGAPGARVRRHVWSLIPGGVPASKVAGADLGATVVLDVDATIALAHSEKEQVAPTFERTYGFHPIGVWCDNTSEFLAAKLRTGRAGSNTAADHIEVLAAVMTQVPGTDRKDC